jgi:hypothetical protein
MPHGAMRVALSGKVSRFAGDTFHGTLSNVTLYTYFTQSYP